jgi:Legume-like lectin family
MGFLTRGPLAILVGGVAGCPAFQSDEFHIAGDTGADDGGGGDLDATRPATDADASLRGDAAPTDGAPGDAGPVDGAPEAATCCHGMADPLDETTFDHWVHEGSARPFAGYVELTSEQINQGGALLWPDAGPVTDFDLRFDFSITKTIDAGLPADGLAFVAMDRVDAQCDAGSQLCLVGTSQGFALVVRTFHSPSEPAVPYVALVDTSRPLASDAGPLVFDGGIAHFDGGIVTMVASTATGDPPAASWKTLCLRESGGRASVTLDGTRILSGVQVAGRSLARWGFVAGTGGSRERNAVRQMEMIGSPVCGDAAPCDASLCGN